MMVQQGDGGVVKTRRNGARLFKNPPQPHMCIQDYVEGWPDPCYVNVLSWGKIAMPNGPSEPVPLWGGMRIPPPRTENRHVAVYAVMANPEILRLNGKNAQDPQERSALIELLLDFVEAMNEGVVFTRCYTVLKDKDITGELKEVWMSVQAKRDREQESQQETWIDVQPPAPQYPQYEMTPEYYYQTNYDQIYQSRQIVGHQYHGNVPQITQDQHNYGERGRQSPPQNQPQQNCPAYPTPQYQFQQLPRQLVPQYINSNIHPNVNANVNPSCSNPNVNPFDHLYAQGREQQQQVVGQPELRDIMHIIRKMHTHPNKQQMMPQYEQPPAMNLQNAQQMNVLRLGRPHMGVTQKSNVSKRQVNSPTHSKQTNNSARQSKEGVENGTKPKSPVKVLQRESNGFAYKESILPLSPDKAKLVEKCSIDIAETQSVQVTDLDEEEAKQDHRKELKVVITSENSNVEVGNETIASVKNRGETVATKSSNAATSQVNTLKNDARQQILNSSDEITVLESDLPLEGTEDDAPNQNLSSKPLKTQILVLKRNSAKSNDSKGNSKDPRAVKNAIRLTKLEGQQIYDLESDRINSKEREAKESDESNQTMPSNEKKLTDNRNGFVQKQKGDRPKKSQTVNNIMKNVFKIHPSTSNDDTSSKKKVNCQTKTNGKTETDEIYRGYAILRKSETNQDEVTSEIAQISIQDCKDTTEVNTVLS